MSRYVPTSWYKYNELRVHLPWGVSEMSHVQRGSLLNRQQTWVMLKGDGTLGCNYCKAGVAAEATAGVMA